jgi:hypothetical protein
MLPHASSGMFDTDAGLVLRMSPVVSMVLGPLSKALVTSRLMATTAIPFRRLLVLLHDRSRCSPLFVSYRETI